MRVGSGAFLLSVVASMVLVNAAPALGHAVYESSDPPDGGTVSSPPSQVSAEFSEALFPDSSFMDVTDPCGADVGGSTTVVGSNMTVAMSGSRAGTYVVSWNAHSSVDGHQTRGSFSFSSTGGDPCPGEEDEGSDGDGRGNGSGGGRASSSDAGSGDASGSGGSISTGSGDRASSSSAGDAGSGGKTKARRSQANEGRKQSRKREGAGNENDFGSIAQGPQSDVPDAPSALEGIPLDGLLITLAVAALIGGAAGKIYVSLSGDE